MGQQPRPPAWNSDALLSEPPRIRLCSVFLIIIRKVLSDLDSESLLFGESLSEKIKEEKQIRKIAKELKQQAPAMEK